MKREMDLIREIALVAEQSESDICVDLSRLTHQHGETKVAVHVRLMKEAGLVEAYVTNTESGHVVAELERLTNSGHDFLDNMRDNKRWRRIKEIAEKESLSTVITVAAQLGVAVVQSKILG